LCGESEAPPPDGNGTCTTPWIDGGTACTYNCTSTNCVKPIVCPADRACELTCQVSGCDSTTITCATGHSCDITCGASSACLGTTIFCPPDAPCSLTCGGSSACSGVTLVCPSENHPCEVVCN